MIKIQKGDTVLTVTRGAYANYYKHLGYEAVCVAKTSENPGEENTHPHDDSQQHEDSTQLKSDEDTFEEEPVDEEPDLSEIPLGEMTFNQLCEYADQLGLDHDGIRKRSELRALIRGHLN